METSLAQQNGAQPSDDPSPQRAVASNAGRQLREKLQAKEATIGVVGLGYVGLPLAVEYGEQGFDVVGIDLDEERIGRLNRGENYIDDISDAAVRQLADDGALQGDTTFDRCGDIDVFYVCVPTPVTEQKEPDVSYIEAATTSIAEHLRPGQLVILKSTTYPSTTEEVVQPILEEQASEQGLHLGEDYFLAFSPERIDPGNEEYTTANTPVVVGGVTPACTKMATLAMEQVVADVHAVSSPRVGEMEKLLENIFRSVNIALVNELAQLCDRMGNVSMWEVIEAAATKPFGFMPFYPGPGLGGHCIPIDPHYLSWIARKYDFETSFITLAARINEQMPYHVTNAVVQAIANQPVRLEDTEILILGVAFKKNVDDTRHSPAQTIVRLLLEKGVKDVRYADPHVDEFTVETQGGDTRAIERVSLSKDVLRDHDVTVVVTDHQAFPYSLVAEHARSIIDTRNALEHIPHNRDKINVLGGGF
jgi:UDP-N-acetyl-D-glucosamine dehydrogenase